MTDNIQNGEGVEARIRDAVEADTYLDGILISHSDALLVLASLAREPATADVDAAIAIVRQHAARIGVPSITVAAAPSSGPAIAEGERLGLVNEDWPISADPYRTTLAAFATTSTPPASKGVEPTTAAELIAIINRWLAKDCDWGAFEKRLDRLCNPDDQPTPSNDTLQGRGEVEREALQEALYLAVCTLAFHGRDRGTDRQERMLDDLEELARKVDPLIRAALQKETRHDG